LGLGSHGRLGKGLPIIFSFIGVRDDESPECGKLGATGGSPGN
jgi:hypothetical protein